MNLAATGLNLVLVDLGDGVKYESHPELAVRNAWSVEHLRQELAKTRQMGLEPIPKLNFSTAHDAWYHLAGPAYHAAHLSIVRALRVVG